MTRRQHIKNLKPKIDLFITYFSSFACLAIFINLGYQASPFFQKILEWGTEYAFLITGSALLFRTLLLFNWKDRFGVFGIGELLLVLYFLGVCLYRYIHYASFLDPLHPEWTYVGLFATLIIETSKKSLFFDRFYFNPTLLFVISFLVLILIGTCLLLLPNATTDHNLRFIDAVFTATSAVCITGLSVVDFTQKFSPFGQHIMLFLFQLGGLGVMTFTGFFGYFFSGGLSYKNQLMYTELIGENKLASVIRTLLKIIFITFLFEALGAVLIFFTVDESGFDTPISQLYFSVFHAVSAFCNAGFSTLENGMSNPLYSQNYSLLIVLSTLIVLGGLGFGIIFNLYSFIRRWIKNLYNFLIYKKSFTYKAWVISFNSRIILYTTFFLVLLGFFGFFIFEYHNTLQAHPTLLGKTITALFMGVTPRTAGFSSVQIHEVTFPLLLIYLFLMWIGASPGSTGGGIKNTTFAIAFLNVFSIARGKENIEIFNRTISNDTVKRALSIISLSFFVIGAAILTLSVTDGHHGLKALSFEVFSAFSTAGLTLGITPELSDAGKIVLIFIMFIGRIGALTLLIAFIKNSKLKAYKYPTEVVDL